LLFAGAAQIKIYRDFLQLCINGFAVFNAKMLVQGIQQLPIYKAWDAAENI
jgi:hypothetical protein